MVEIIFSLLMMAILEPQGLTLLNDSHNLGVFLLCS
jgi:hypothetical protein